MPRWTKSIAHRRSTRTAPQDLLKAYRSLFGLGDMGSVLISVEDNGDPRVLSRLVQVLEEKQISFSRLVRKAATARFGKAAYGRVYGFVYSGLDLGLALAPVIFGGLMDARRFGSVLIGIAVFQTLAIFAALRVGKAD